MRHAAGELTDRLHLLCLAKLRLELLALGEVARRGDDEPLVVFTRLSGTSTNITSIVRGAPGHGAASDVMLRLSGAQAFAQMVQRDLRRLDAEDLFDRAADDLVARHAVGRLGMSD